MARFSKLLLVLIGGSALIAGCDPLSRNSQDSHLGEHWGSNDDPSNFDGNLEYVFDELPLEGEADPIPWAGSYWPTAEDSINKVWEGNGTLSPASKYGEAFDIDNIEDAVSQYHGIDGQSSRTECTEDSQCNSDLGESCAKRDGEENGYCIPTWWGLCHGWAPAAIMEPEPVHDVEYNGVTFRPNDIKALMTLMYTSTNVKFLSGRNNDNDDAGEIEYDPYDRPIDQSARDTNPGTFHVIAANYLGIKKVSFVEDRTFDYEVWNQPMRGFEVTRNEEVTELEANALVGVTHTGGDIVEHEITVKKDDWHHFDPMAVEADEFIKVKIDGNADSDLYVRFGAQPTDSEYDCRPYGGNSETCEVTAPEDTELFVSVKGYADESEVKVTIMTGGESATEYVFNDNAVKFIHIKATAEYISESASSVGGNLADSIDTYTKSDHYEYVLELDGEGRIIGGEWVGASKRAHPDFLWLPLSQSGASKAGGKITYDKVKMLLDMSLEEPGTGDDDDDDDAGDPQGNEEVTVTESGTVAVAEWIHYGPYNVAAMADLEAVMTGTGDADLYVRKGAQPTESDYDCRPYASGSSEECIVEGPGDIYVAVYGYEDASEYTLTITYKSGDGSEGGDEGGDEGGEEEGGGDGQTSEELEVSESGTVAKDEWKHFGPYPVAAAGALLAEMTGTGDADLYVKLGSQPTSELYDCRPYSSGTDENCDLDGPGDVYVSVNGYAETSDFELTVIYDAAQ